jgi:hypothetical protein
MKNKKLRQYIKLTLKDLYSLGVVKRKNKRKKAKAQPRQEDSNGVANIRSTSAHMISPSSSSSSFMNSSNLATEAMHLRNEQLKNKILDDKDVENRAAEVAKIKSQLDEIAIDSELASNAVLSLHNNKTRFDEVKQEMSNAPIPNQGLKIGDDVTTTQGSDSFHTQGLRPPISISKDLGSFQADFDLNSAEIDDAMVTPKKAVKWQGIFGSGLFAGTDGDDDNDNDVENEKVLGPRNQNLANLKAEAAGLGITPTQLHKQSAAAIKILIKENRDLPLLKQEYKDAGGKDPAVFNSSSIMIVNRKLEDAKNNVFKLILSRKQKRESDK